MTQKITPHLWFDKSAKEAAEFYVSAFGRGSKIVTSNTIHNTPSGDCDIVSFELAGYGFMSISAGPYFKINPSVSFFINFDPSKDTNAKANLNALWEKLSIGGKALMPLQKYPFSDWYGWVQDKYGVTWQLMLTNPSGEERPFIIPSLLFTKEMFGKAEAAVNFYRSVFKNTKLGTVAMYPKEMGPETQNKIMFSDFMLESQWFAGMDGAGPHDFKFNEAVSFIVHCENQDEVDYYWEKLSAVPESERCGWLKDMYGVSWQIVPNAMEEFMSKGTTEQTARVTNAFLKMKKFDIATLKKAYDGE